MQAGKLWGMRRLAGQDGRFKMIAVDQRPPIKAPIAAHYGVPVEKAPFADVAKFKRHLVTSLMGEATAFLLDPHFAVPACLSSLDPRCGLVVTLEDSQFTDDGNGRYSEEIDHWSVAKIKRMGGNAVKLLIWYRPDAGEKSVRHQQDFAKRTGEACAHYDIPFLLELLVHPLESDQEQSQDYVEMQSKHSDLVLQSIEDFAKPDYGVDIFKLESPVAAPSLPPFGESAATQSLFKEMGQIAGRPWVMLSAGAGKDQFFNVLSYAYEAGASGYLAGRAIWLQAIDQFPDWAGITRELEGTSRAYMKKLNDLTDKQARAWFDHPAYGEKPDIVPNDGGFRLDYAEI